MSKKLFIFLIILSGCAQNAFLGTKKMALEKQPRMVVWYQISGLSNEHLPLVKYDNSQQATAKIFEEVQCVGTLWPLSLYEIRPTSKIRMTSQLSGDPDIKGSCSDIRGHFLWDYADKVGYQTTILENENTNDSSLESYFKCSEFDSKKVSLVRMSPSKGQSQEFHFQESKMPIMPGISFDKSCNSQSCFSGWQNNMKSIVERMRNINQKSFVVFQDHTFANNLKQKKILEAKEFLIELANNLKWLSTISNGEILVIVSGNNSLPIEMPTRGEDWVKFLKSGDNITYHKDSLVSPLYAFGASSENFCGVYPDEDILRRIFFAPDDGFFSLKKFKSLFN